MTPLSFLENLLGDPELVPVVVLGGLAFLVLTAVFWVLLVPDRDRQLQRRIDRVKAPSSAKRPTTDAQQVESLRRSTKDSSIASLDRLIKRVIPNLGLMRLRLQRSGWPLKIGDYLLICLGLGMVTTLGLTLALDFPILANALAGVVIGLGLPHLVLSRRIAQRMRRFTLLLPEAIDLIVRGIRSGLPVTEALRTIADEIADPVGSEFRQVTDQMKIGVALDEAMWAVAKKLQIAEVNFLVISMSIQQETGGNLAEILEKLSDMVRRREQMRLKVKAMSSEARASAMIIGALPFIMCGLISFINPGYMGTLFTDPRGWVMIGMGLSSLAVGVLVMSKMVRFEI